MAVTATPFYLKTGSHDRHYKRVGNAYVSGTYKTKLRLVEKRLVEQGNSMSRGFLPVGGLWSKKSMPTYLNLVRHCHQFKVAAVVFCEIFSTCWNCTRLKGFMLNANESDNDLIRVCATLAKSGSRSPVSSSFNFSRMLSWNRSDVTEENLMLSGIIRDCVQLRDSKASDSNIVDILN